MGCGLMQLVAYGAQDIYLTGSPQITFFKVVYRRRYQLFDGKYSANLEWRGGGGCSMFCHHISQW